MLTFPTKLIAGTAFVFALCANAFTPQAALAAQHPEYLHGLKDLRIAHQLLTRRSFANVNWHEIRARKEIDQSYRYAASAAIWDGLPLNAPVGVDANLHHRERLVRALAALRAAHRDFMRYESNGADRTWRHDAIVWVDKAIWETRRALHAQNWDIDR